MDRRAFLGTLAAGAALAPEGGTAFGAAEPVRLGVIGCGWYGGVVLDAAFKAGGVEAIGLCDVDTEHLEKTARKVEGLQGKKPRTFEDWRELLDAPGLQAVVIATPPHWHALPFIEACRRGKDVYCEKPLAYDVREGQAMVEAARASGRVIQVGFQRRQSDAVRQVKDHVAAGHAGRIVSAAAQIHYAPQLQDPTEVAPPPTLDWDAWCGPAPKLPYSRQVGHFHWRLEEAYGNGHLVDWGIHWIDALRNVLGLGLPRAITAAGGIYGLKGRITTPDVLTAHFEFDRCPVVWSHRIFGAAEATPQTSIAMFLYGEKETIAFSDSRYEVFPATKPGDPPAAGAAERRVVEAKNDQQTAHVAEWLEAVRTRGKVSCPPEDAWRSTTAVQLAMVALKAGGRVDWDEAGAMTRDNPRAAALLKRDYRGPWVHPWKA